MSHIRVRVAPSPTGDPHVGTAYVTLFNYAFAKKHQGKLILRIEDTDQKRARATSEAQIFASLRWLGLDWDEGPDVGGSLGPYRQSERLGIYREHVAMLTKSGAAYPCFCTAERLTKMRASQKGHVTGYDGHCRDLGAQEVAKLQAQGIPCVIRLKIRQGGSTTFKDQLRGDVTVGNDRIDDQVLFKSDGYPTYHLANVVDDHLMKITHVMRAEEWISSTPKHVLLYEAFGWEPPQFIHLPLLRNADKSKISKRRNPVSLNYYRRKGILPQALLNFLGCLGFSYGDDREFFTLDELIAAFDFKKIHLGGPVFDLVKLTSMNHKYMQELTPEEYLSHLTTDIFHPTKLAALVPLMRERVECFEQFVDKTSFFFNGALNYQDLLVVPKGKTQKDFNAMLHELAELLDAVDDWTAPALEAVLQDHQERIGAKPKDYLMPLRLVTTGRKDSPPLVETLAALGPDIVRFRLRDYIASHPAAEG